MIRFSFLFLLEHENLSQGSQAFHCFSLSLPLLSFTGLDTHLSLLSYSSLPLPGWNSDHGCCFISSLHFSLLLRLMVCCAINDSAKSGHSIKEGDWTGGGGALRILLLMGREKLDVCAFGCHYLCCVQKTNGLCC